jgi:hypothetical protein
MKIISNFKDYYDSAGLAYGLDEKLVYVRKTEVVDNNLLSLIDHESLSKYYKLIPRPKYFNNFCSLTTDYHIKKYIIGYCGKLYSAWSIEKENIICYFTSAEQIENYLIANKLLVDLKEFNTPYLYSKSHINTALTFGFPFRKYAIKYWLDNYSGKELSSSIFYKINAPTFSYTQSLNKIPEITINPILKNYSFAQVIEPLTAFNEVSMFVGGINSQHEGTAYYVGDDKFIALSKGMCPKTSFHQVAPTKKEKRKLNKQKKAKGSRS